MIRNFNREVERYEEAIKNLTGEEEDIKAIKELIDKYYSMNRRMVETSIYDVFEYEDRITSSATDSLRYLTTENSNLKAEINKLRVKMKLSKKYREDVSNEPMERK